MLLYRQAYFFFPYCLDIHNQRRGSGARNRTYFQVSVSLGTFVGTVNCETDRFFFQMFPHLPQEVIDRIAYYLPFEKAVEVSKYMKEKLGDKADWFEYAKEGNVFGLQWMNYHGLGVCSDWAMDYAAEEGHLEAVKWLHKNRRERCTKKAMDYTARKGHWDVLQWLHYNRSEGCTTDAMNWAAENGHLEIVKWLHENRDEGCTEDEMDWAAAKVTWKS